MRFDGQVAVITGGASGLGRAYAIALAERGANVAILDVVMSQSDRHKAPNDIVNMINALGVECRYYSVDVSIKEQVEQAIADVMQQWHRIDILINNASIHQPCDFEHLTQEAWQQQIDVDINGSFWVTKAVWSVMKLQQYGRVLMSTGVMALFGDMHQTSFSTTKMALVGLVNSLCKESVTHGIHVNSLCPHGVTSMTEKHLAANILPLFSLEAVLASMLLLVSEQAPNGQHLLAGAGSVSHGMFTEFKGIHFNGDDCNADNLAQHWPQLYRAMPVSLHHCGEDVVAQWAKRAAIEHNIEIE